MQRDVLIESGYRCAIPHCRETQIQIHHIEDYAKVKEHTFDNLIALCANCHQRVTKGEIPRKAVLQIKANLSVLGHRYVEVEKRYLQFAADRRLQVAQGIVLPGGFELLMWNLVTDGLVSRTASTGTIGAGNVVFPVAVHYLLTEKGHDFVERWLAAEPLGPGTPSE